MIRRLGQPSAVTKITGRINARDPVKLSWLVKSSTCQHAGCTSFKFQKLTDQSDT